MARNISIWSDTYERVMTLCDEKDITPAEPIDDLVDELWYRHELREENKR